MSSKFVLIPSSIDRQVLSASITRCPCFTFQKMDASWLGFELFDLEGMEEQKQQMLLRI